MAKKMIDECLEMLDTTSFEGSVDSVIGFIANIRAESHAEGYSNLRFVADRDCEDVLDGYALWGSRKERQEEAERREERERKAESSQLKDLHQQELATRLARMTDEQIDRCLNIAVGVELEEEEDE